MRILYLNDDFPPEAYGGAAMVVYDTAMAATAKGHEVFVVTTSVKGVYSERTEKGIKIFTLSAGYHPFFRHYLSLYNPFLAGKIKKIIRKIKPDVVHAHNIHTNISYSALKIAKKSGAKVFLTAHDTMLVSYGKVHFPCGEKNFKVTTWLNIKTAGKRYNPFRNIVIKYYLQYVDEIFAISGILKNFLAQNSIKSKILYNGINTELWKNLSENDVRSFKDKYKIAGKKVVFFGGRLSGAKGGWQILKIFSKLVENLGENRVILLIAGKDANEQDGMKNFIQKHKIKNNIVFTGWLDRVEMKKAFFVSDVCVTPSIYFDPFNLFNIEAMAAGKPVVGTCFGGTPEIVINNETGYIVNPLDEKQAADKIYNLLVSRELAIIFGKNGRKRVEEEFSLNKQIDKMLNFYNN